MDIYNLPEILVGIPDKLKPIITQWKKYSYFLIDGGRGSAKTQTIARLCLYLADTYKIRVFNGRETECSIEDSVYTVYKNLIESYNLNYEVQEREINGLTKGSALRFRGFRKQNTLSIRGIEDVQILWIDEAQYLTKDTIKTILPTIRPDNSKVIFTLNRLLRDDAVWEEFKDRPDCLKIHIDYFENPQCPQKLIDEANSDKARNLDDYKHIWLGEPLSSANNAVFRNVMDVVGADYIEPIPAENGVEYVLGVDLARSVDYTWLIIINVRHKRIDYIERMENENKTSWNYQKEKIRAVSAAYNQAVVVLDSTGVGDPIVEDLQRQGVRVWHEQLSGNLERPGVKFTSISKENIIERLKVAIEMKMIIIPNHPVLIKELEIFEATILPSRSYRYAAPEGKHDDGVIALALALWGIRSEVYNTWKATKQPTRDERFWERVKSDMKQNSLETDGQDIGEGSNIADENPAEIFED